MASNLSQDITLLLLSKQENLFCKFKEILRKAGVNVVNIDDLHSLDVYLDRGNDELCLCIFGYDLSDPTLSLEPLDRLLSAGHSLIIASCEEDENQRADLNKVVARFGVYLNDEPVIRPNLYKEYHPNEAMLEDFSVNRGFTEIYEKYAKIDPIQLNENFEEAGLFISKSRILYVRGCTLQVGKSSIVIMTSSKWSLPTNQAICSYHRDAKIGFRVVIFGSALMMSDRYIDKENNTALARALIELASNKKFPVNMSDARTLEIPETNYTPDINQLADIPISSWQEPDKIPEDKLKLLDTNLFNIESSFLPEIKRAYIDLNIRQEPLTLIKPDFDFAPLKLEPAVHGFRIKRSGK